MFLSKSSLSKKQKSVVSELMTLTESYDPYMGRTATVTTPDSITIWYEDIGDVNDPAVLLIMGHSFTALHWPNYFVQALVDAGYRVIRYDNRGVGMSSRLLRWKKSEAYSTRDMARDGIAILNDLQIDRAHIVGVSMGGMIAQDLGLDFPERVKTLTLAMTTGELFGKGLSKPSAYFISSVIKIMAQSRGKMNRQTAPIINVAFANVLHRDRVEDETRALAQNTLYEFDQRGGWTFTGAAQHTEAMKLRGGRWKELSNLEIPTLIVHGDRDPIFGPDHAERLAENIPNSQLTIIGRLGHYLPRARTDDLINPLVTHFQS